MKNGCEFKYCASNNTDTRTIAVHENIGDGSFRTEICQTCADIVGLKEGSDIPDDADKVNRILRKARKQKK